MSLLSQLPKLVTSRLKRKGRGYGSGSGAKSGRGTTRHQTARRSMPLFFEGGQNRITKKYPLLRGKLRNKSVQPRPYVMNVSDLSIFPENTRVDVKLLLSAHLIGKDVYTRGVKILGRGVITKPMHVALPVSKKAGEKISHAGGTLIEA